MKENNENQVNKQKIAKVAIPLILLLIIIGIWFIKNGIDMSSNDINVQIDTQETSEDETSSTASTDILFDLQVTDPLNLEDIKSHGLPIIIDFGSDSCIPCQEMAPVLEKINTDFQGRAIILFVDVWEYPEIAEGLPIRVIPTQLIFDANGDPYMPSQTLDLDVLMYADESTEEHIFTAHEGGLTEDMMLLILSELGVE